MPVRSSFEAELAGRLAALRGQDLYRELRRVDSPQSPIIEVARRRLLNFSSNDYLGLANEPALKAAALEAVGRYGAGAGASRLLCGSLAPHHELEETLAAFKGTPAALSFSTGYSAAVGTITALAGKEDIVILDKLVHACIVDGARLSGAKIRVFAHNDLNDLDEILRWSDASLGPHRDSPSRGHALIITESLFSMDGDQAPLREMVALKERYGAWLMVDEAHAAGLYGAKRRGLAEELGASDGIEIQMGTLGKAIGAAGGFICGSRALIDYLVNRARSFIFSTAPVPAAAAAATAGIRFLQSDAGAERCRLLWDRVAHLNSGIKIKDSTLRAAIVPLLIGSEAKAIEAAAALRERGIFVPAVRYPTVGRGRARLRLTLTAAHGVAEVDQLLAALRALNLAPQADPGLSGDAPAR